MKVAYFDCIGGADGNMLLGALADAGVSADAIVAAASALRLPGCELRFAPTTRGGFSALQAVVATPHEGGARPLDHWLNVLHSAELPPAITDKARRMLLRLAEAESRARSLSVESVSWPGREGASLLVALVGVLAGLEALAVGRVVVSPLPLARGWINSSDGLQLLPTSVTLELLKGVPVYAVAFQTETVAPAGALLLTGIADQFGALPAMNLIRVGSGAGHAELPVPNLIRLWIGDAQTGSMGFAVEALTVIESDIDDMSPQVYDYVMDRLFASGALDVTLTPLQMKKNRPGVKLTVLCQPAGADELIRLIIEETSTLGVRRHNVDRLCLPRMVESVDTAYGPIRIKVARWEHGSRHTVEFEDCRQAAAKHHVPLLEVMTAAQAALPRRVKN